MTKSIFALVAFAGTIALSAPAVAGVGGIVQPADLIDTFDRTCSAGAPNFARSIPSKARAENWDALQRRGQVKAQGWMLAVGGSPVIIDIEVTNPARARCSASAVSDPRIILQALQRNFRRAPDFTRTENGMRVTGWNLQTGGVKRTVSVGTVPGRMLARINMRLGA